MSRREFTRVTATGLLGVTGWRTQDDGRLRARPRRPSDLIAPGEHALGLSSGRDGLVYVPASYRPDHPAPLVLALHGATGSGLRQLAGWRESSEANGFIVLAPDSRAGTWDGADGGFGPDVTFIDSALMTVFRRCSVAADRLIIAGFSDGASYALSMGLVNGDLFRRVVAFSPGFIVPGTWTGEPKFFVSHGRSDPILNIDRASRRLVTVLRRGGYSVTYREFDGGHEVPAGIRAEAVGWMLTADG
jgi:phospholipase/carboxylesterase